MNVSIESSLKQIVLLSLLLASSKVFAACNEGDVPLGSGNISTGTQLSKTVVDEKANPSTGGDGDVTFTYRFNSNDSPAKCGRHADGTWWLAPASGQTDVTLTAITANLTIKAEDNPDPAARGFLDNSGNYGHHDASKNIIPNLPINYPLNNDSISSIFSVIQRNANCDTRGILEECIEFADFLTIYDSPPIVGGRESIRPTIFGNNKNTYRLSDFDLSRIPNINGADSNFSNAEVLTQVSKWTATTEGFSIPFCDLDYENCTAVSEGGRAFRSHAVIDDYANNGGQNSVLSYLFSDTSNVINDAEDKALLAAVLAYGLDIITLIANPPSSERYIFSSGAGQWMNAATFSYLTAALSPRNSFLWNTMSVDVRSWVDLELNAAPQEIQQIYDFGNGPIWGDYAPIFSDLDRRRYWTEIMNGMTHDNSTDNLYVFTTPYAGNRYLIQDDTSGLVIPPVCNFGRDVPEVRLSYCRQNVVVVDDIILSFFDHTPDGSYIVLSDPVPAGTTIQVSAITEVWQGTNGGNRVSTDPHGYIDGPPASPGFGYFEITAGPRFEFAAMVQAMPELCEVVNTPSLLTFVERYYESGLQTGNDPCAAPSVIDINNSNCDVFKTRGCDDYGLSNNGTVRWGPDPRDNTQCVHNNTLLTQQNDGTWSESFENRGDTGRFSRLNGMRNNKLPKTYTDQYLAFKGDRDCAALLSGGETPPPPPPTPVPSDNDDDLLMMIPMLVASINKEPANPITPSDPPPTETPTPSAVVGLEFVSVINIGTDQYNSLSTITPQAAPVAIRLSSSSTDAVNFSAIIRNGLQPNRIEFSLSGPTSLARGEGSAPYTLASTFTPFSIANGDLPLGTYQLVVTPEFADEQDETPAIFNFTLVD